MWRHVRKRVSIRAACRGRGPSARIGMVGRLVRGGCGEVWPRRGEWSGRIAIEGRIIVSIFRVFLECSFICLFVILLAHVGTPSGHDLRWR